MPAQRPANQTSRATNANRKCHRKDKKHQTATHAPRRRKIRIADRQKKGTPMYTPSHFEETRPEVLNQLISDHPLGAMVTLSLHGLDANHIPFEFDAKKGPNGTLRAHVARANPVWQEAANNPDAMVIFQGPTAYISPTWYPSKHETHRQVPTYNYMVVHAHGRIVVHDDETFVRGLVARLTRKMEAGEPVPWKMGDAPADFISQMLGAIVGIEIEVTKLTGKWKLSQNKASADRRGAATTLSERESDAQRAVSDAMVAAPPALD
jgi:transcriptional regulator